MFAAQLKKRLSHTEPATIEGHCTPEFNHLKVGLQRMVTRHRGGAALSVYHKGVCVVDLWGGEKDSAGNPWQRDTMAPSFSTTKGVASTLMHIMVDRGLIDYDDKVADYWPEFAQAGKENITLRQVMSHQSGLYHIRQMIDRAERMLDWKHMIAAIERTAPIHQPGTRTGYHGLTYGFLIGELIQRITNKPFTELVQTEISAPLKLDGLFIGTPKQEIYRASELLWPSARRLIDHPSTIKSLDLTGGLIALLLKQFGVSLDVPSIVDALAPRGVTRFDFGSEETLRSVIPAGNGLFTARSLARMYACLANYGELDGVSLLSPTTVNRATELQTPTGYNLVIPMDMRWRLGYHGVFTTRGIPRFAFGHFGFGGSGAWADPSRKLSLGLIVNSGVGSPFGDYRIAHISGLAIRAAKSID